MKIVLVSPYRPSRLGLNEYTYHLGNALLNDSNVELFVLADQEESGELELVKNNRLHIIRCWKYNSLNNCLRILKCIKEIKPDVVWFNLLFTSFGDKRFAAFFGLLTPLLCRLAGYYTVTTLHHLFEFINLKDSLLGRSSLLDKIAGRIATKLLLCSHTVFVTLAKYARCLKERYSANNVVRMPHGFFEFSVPQQAPLQGYNILVFGKFGTYKRIEFALEVFEKLEQRFPDARLVIAGMNHPSAHGYLENLANRHSDHPRICFKGYVKEEDLPRLFLGTDVMFLPYTSTTGVPSVALHGCRFGIPVVIPDLPDVAALISEEGITLETFPPNDTKTALRILTKLFEDRELLQKLGKANFDRGNVTTLSKVAERYLEIFRQTSKAQRRTLKRQKKIG